VLNAVVPTGTSVQTFTGASLTLVAQVAMRGLMLVFIISLIMGTSRWAEGAVDALLDFRGVLSLGLFSVFSCLLLRVYVVVLADDSDDYPTVRDYWEEPMYVVVFLLHLFVSLWLYYACIGAARDLGRVR